MLRQTSGAAFRPTPPSRLRRRLMASWLYKAFRGEILIGWLFFLEARLFVSALLLMSRNRGLSIETL